METTTQKFTDFSFFASQDLRREGALSPEASELKAWAALKEDLRNEVARSWIARHLGLGEAPRVFVDAGFFGGREVEQASAHFTHELYAIFPDTLQVFLVPDVSK